MQIMTPLASPVWEPPVPPTDGLTVDPASCSFPFFQSSSSSDSLAALQAEYQLLADYLTASVPLGVTFTALALSP